MSEPPRVTQTPAKTDARALPLLGRLWRTYLKKHWPWLVFAAILMTIEGSMLGLLSYALQPMFDRVLVGGDEGFIYILGGGIMALFCIRAVAGVSQRIVLTRVGQISVAEMQTDLVSHMMSLDSAYFHDNAPGALMERVQGDTAAIQNVWQTLIQGAARDAIALISLAVVAISIDPVWTVAALVGVPALVIPTAVLQRYLRRKAGAMRDAAYDRSVRLSEVFHGIDLVKLSRLEAYQTARFREIVNRLVGMSIKFAGGGSLLPGLLDVMVGVGFFAVLVFGGQEIMSGEKSVGEFMSFFTAMALAFQPMRRLAALAGILQTTAASLDRVFSVLDLKAEIRDPATPRALPETFEIRLDNLHFTYGDHPVLQGAGFTAEAGKTTAIVGPSGAGKSTIFNLLTRLIEPQGGSVTIGGVPVSDLPLSDLRGLFSFVTQDAPVFDETLRENILLGRSDLDADELARTLSDSDMEAFVANLPDGLETRAGPRGSNLSGGQRQRLAIARAILQNAPILLLDEATSALDAQSEAAIQSALERLSKGRTTLVIAHRLATIRNADKIVVMDRGRVVDQGTHEELLARDGLYAGLYRLQFREADDRA